VEPVIFNPVYPRDHGDKIRYGYRPLHVMLKRGRLGGTWSIRDVRVFPVSGDDDLNEAVATTVFVAVSLP
jgi:hypothetical protein